MLSSTTFDNSSSSSPSRPVITREDELPKVLEALSSLAREIDAGTVTLAAVHRSDKLPDQLMSFIRRWVKTSPEQADMLLAYLRSSDEPIAARILAVLSLSQCWEPHVMELAKTILSGDLDERLASAYISSYWTCDFEVEPKWSDLLPWVRPLGDLPVAYEYLDWGWGGGWSASLPKGVTPTPVLEGLLDSMDRERGKPFPKGLALAIELFLRCPDAMPELRTRFRFHLERSFLADVPDDQWRGSMDALVRTTGRPGHKEIIARGLDTFPFQKRMETINELCAYGGDAILDEPFQKHVKEALGCWSRSAAEGGPPPGSPGILIPHLLLVGHKQGWRELLLLNSPSIVLRRNAARSLEIFMGRGSPPSNWYPWMDYLDRLLEDPDLEIQLSAAASLINGLHARWQRLNKPGYGDQVEVWRRRIEGWFETVPNDNQEVLELRARLRRER